MRKSRKLNGISLGDMRSVPFVLILGALWKPVTGDLVQIPDHLFTETPL